jgi:hypothetical protein
MCSGAPSATRSPEAPTHRAQGVDTPPPSPDPRRSSDCVGGRAYLESCLGVAAGPPSPDPAPSPPPDASPPVSPAPIVSWASTTVPTVEGGGTAEEGGGPSST